MKRLAERKSLGGWSGWGIEGLDRLIGGEEWDGVGVVEVCGPKRVGKSVSRFVRYMIYPSAFLPSWLPSFLPSIFLSFLPSIFLSLLLSIPLCVFFSSSLPYSGMDLTDVQTQLLAQHAALRRLVMDEKVKCRWLDTEGSFSPGRARAILESWGVEVSYPWVLAPSV